MWTQVRITGYLVTVIPLTLASAALTLIVALVLFLC